jgi:acyl-coenzyme A synthetase/AMP-(fatty) acid ligase
MNISDHQGGNVASELPRIEDCFTPEQIGAFRSLGAWPGDVLWSYTERWALERPDHLAVSDGDESLSFLEVRDQAASFAQGLADLGIVPGDRVVVQVPNWVEGLVAYLGVTRLGAVMIPQSIIYRQAELGYVAQKTGARLLVVPGEHRHVDHVAIGLDVMASSPTIEHLVVVRGSAPGATSFGDLVRGAPYAGPLPSADDVHIIIFTSGTTAKPKACVHTTNTYLYCARKLIEGQDLTTDDVMFMASPITHTTGVCCGLVMPTMLGITTVFQDAWDPEVALNRISKYGCSVSVGATPFLQTMAEVYSADRHDVSRFRLFGTGGAPVPGPVVEKAVDRLDCKVMTLFGQSESQPGTFTRLDDPIERIASSDGRAAPGVEIAIFDLDGAEVPRGAEGEICARSPGRMLCYWGDPEGTAATIDADGWCHSGDLGRMDGDGYIRVTGRKKDIIVRGGLNLSALEIEEYVLRHAAVREVAVVGMPDERLGEKVCAFVVVEPGERVALEDVTALLRSFGLAVQKLPERVEVVDDLPRNPTGKVQKHELRERIARSLAAEHT